MSVLESLTVTRAAAYRQPAWMGLGNVFTEPVTDFNEMLRLSSLDQILIHEETLTPQGGEARFVVPVKAFVAEDVTTGERKVIGIVGDERTLIKPDEGFAFLQSLGDGMAWEIAGTLRDDRTAFGALRFDTETKVAGETLQRFLTVAFAFDGTLPLTVFLGNIRPECQNSLTNGMQNAAQSFKVRQTKNARDRMAVQAETFRRANAYFGEWEKGMQLLAVTPFTEKQFENLILSEYKKPESEGAALTRWEDKRDAHFAMWNADHNANIKGTAYGAWNVMCEVQQWGRQERDNPTGRENFALSGAGFDALTEKFRNRTLATVAQRVKVSV